jgi:hypothetical protein
MANAPEGNRLQIVPATSRPAWQQPLWLAEWTAELPVPVPREQISQEIMAVESSLTPMDQKGLAMLLVQTLNLYGAPENWAAIADFYLEALADVPADLVPQTMKNVRMTCKWFPKPSEFRDAVPEDFRRRRLALARLRVARLNAVPERVVDHKPLTPAQQAEIDAIKARLAPAKPSKRRVTGFRQPIGKIVTAPLPGEDDPRAQDWRDRMGG